MEIVGKEFKEYRGICKDEMGKHVQNDPFKVIGDWSEWKKWMWMHSSNQVFGLRFKQVLWFELKKYIDEEEQS
jgi:hypothetical protein